MQSLSHVSRTPMRRFGAELGISLALGLVTAIAVTWMHVEQATFDATQVTELGKATVDDLDFPEWLCVITEKHGATALLVRHFDTMDHAVAREIMANRGDMSLRAPRWSLVFDDRAAPPQSAMLEQVHGWPLPMFYRAQSVGASPESITTRRVMLPGAAIAVMFFAVAWLVVIRLPGSLKRAQRWMAAKREAKNPHPSPLPRGEGARATTRSAA